MKTCVLVTAAGKNTGLTIARRFAEAGSDVVITGRDPQAIAPVAAQIAADYGVQSFAVGLNQVDTATVAPAFDEISARGYVVDTLVCNAANPGIGQPVLSTPLADWRNVIDTNVVGTYAVCAEAVRRMVEAGVRGSIAIIASNQAHRGVPERSAYGASKGALSAMTKVFAVELAQYGIRTNCVMPGRIRTDVMEKMPPAAVQEIIDRTPTRALIEQDEVADAVLFLASPAAKNITGTDFVIDGGCEVNMFSS